MINRSEKKEGYNFISKYKPEEEKRISGNIKKTGYYFTVKYKPNENNRNKVKIFGKIFVNRNEDKCKIIYNNKIYELKEYFEDIDINYNHKDLIKFKLLLIHNIIDMSYMFYDCDSLISLSVNNETNLNNSNLQLFIINMNHMFYRCISLKSLLIIIQIIIVIIIV